MNFLSIDLTWLVLFLISINFITAIAIRTEEKYWLPQMIIMIFLLGILVFQNTLNREHVIQKEIIYDQQTNLEEKSNLVATLELEAAKKQRKDENRKLLRLLGLQSIISFFSQFVGYRQTGKTQFRSGLKTFFLLFIIYLVIEIVWLFGQQDAVNNPL